VTPREIAVLGAGGMAREVACLILDISAAGPQKWTVRGLVEAAGRPPEKEQPIGRWKVFATDDQIDRLPRSLAIGIGNPGIRLMVGKRMSEAGFELPSLVHPSLIAGDVEVGGGAVIYAGNIITTNVTIGPYSCVNPGCTIGHDATIGAGVVVNPGVNISGDVHIGPGTLVGTGATILQGIKIGRGATIGGGALVRSDVPDGVTVVGVPAKPLERK
jgi:sugar O-acyltransferase (sialic acid O-acetyltransferase NeuD family)